MRDVHRVDRPADALAPPATRALVVWTSGATTRCPRCGRRQPLELFGRTRGRRQGWCRPCFREHPRQRGAAHVSQVMSSKRRRRDTAREWLQAYLADHCCVDCGETDAVVLEFDHVDVKSAHLSTLVNNGWRLDRIVAEAARCEVVCASCHRRRTAGRAGWVRADPEWRSRLGSLATPRARNLLHIYSYLAARGCADCATDDLVVLDFDHVGEKTGR